MTAALDVMVVIWWSMEKMKASNQIQIYGQNQKFLTDLDGFLQSGEQEQEQGETLRGCR